MMKIALVALCLGLVSLSSFAKDIELNAIEKNTLMNNMISFEKSPDELKQALAYITSGGIDGETYFAKELDQECKFIGRSMLVICKTTIGVESDIEDEDSGFDSIFEVESVHLMRSMSLLRVTLIPLAG